MTTEAGRWCYYCGVLGPGWHRPDGSFDPTSVEVTEGELLRAASKHPYVGLRAKHSHWSIALGKHLGVYDPELQQRPGLQIMQDLRRRS